MTLLLTSISQAISAITVVGSDDGSSVIIVQAHDFCGLCQRRLGLHEPQQVPTSSLDGVLTTSVSRFELLG